MAIGQHAVHAGKSIPVPTWTRPPCIAAYPPFMGWHSEYQHKQGDERAHGMVQFPMQYW